MSRRKNRIKNRRNKDYALQGISRTVIAFTLLSILLGLCFPVDLLANSVQVLQGGSSGAGIVVDGESPLQVKKEILTFDLSEFPESYYETPRDYLSYSGKVTAQYVLYNPSDKEVNSTLLFPFGYPPDYGVMWDNEGNTIMDADTEKYEIKLNGEAVEKKLRHSFIRYYEEFDLERDLPLLADGYVNDSFYSPTLPVTKYTWVTGGVDTEKYEAASLAFELTDDMTGSKVFFPRNSGYSMQDDGTIRLSAWVDGAEPTLELYYIGTKPRELPQITFYKDGGVEDGDEIPGFAEYVGEETISFEDIALEKWSEVSGVSRTDWYNAVVAWINASSEGMDRRVVSTDIVGTEGFDVKDYLLRWYEYEITVGAGQEAVNEVTAPMYPAINMAYEPYQYHYTYLLSPAQKWASFGELEVRIHTPFYVTESSIGQYEETEDGYAFSAKGLPEGELEFTLCEAENPDYVTANRGSSFLPHVILFIAGAFIALVFVVSVIVIILKKKN